MTDKENKRRYGPVARWDFINAVIRSRGVTGGAIKVLTTILDHTNKDTGRAWISYETLIRETRCGNKTVERSITSLERQEWFKVHRLGYDPTAKRFRASVYLPNWEKAAKTREQQRTEVRERKAAEEQAIQALEREMAENAHKSLRSFCPKSGQNVQPSGQNVSGSGQKERATRLSVPGYLDSDISLSAGAAERECVPPFENQEAGRQADNRTTADSGSAPVSNNDPAHQSPPGEPLVRSTPAADAFDRFCAVYPKRINRKKTQAAWATAVTKADPEVIIATAKRYAAYLTGTNNNDPALATRFATKPWEWLDDERWNDDLPENPHAEAIALYGQPPPGIKASEWAVLNNFYA